MHIIVFNIWAQSSIRSYVKLYYEDIKEREEKDTFLKKKKMCNKMDVIKFLSIFYHFKITKSWFRIEFARDTLRTLARNHILKTTENKDVNQACLSIATHGCYLRGCLFDKPRWQLHSCRVKNVCLSQQDYPVNK